MATEKLRLRTGELYTRDEVCKSLECGDWLVNVLVSLFGLTRLGTGSRAHFEGGDVITALRRHATHDVVEVDLELHGPATQEVLLRLKRERKRERKNATG
jgi:hypothetical protein